MKLKKYIRGKMGGTGSALPVHERQEAMNDPCFGKSQILCTFHSIKFHYHILCFSFSEFALKGFFELEKISEKEITPIFYIRFTYHSMSGSLWSLSIFR
ncbi:MAG: hypothetical protein JRI91_05660 [Deltaproteobacteria bacterium]|nr:hypothetical protein [Deltaproteobacteria bacterium]